MTDVPGNPEAIDQNGRLAVVDALRGIAALSVCWFHLTNGNPRFLPDGWLKRSGGYGWLGVDIFFVISGFIVPYSMGRRGYQWTRDGARFVAKRVIRLDPPYLVAAALALVLGYASAMVPGFRGSAPHPTLPQVLAHVGYLNGLLGLPWLNPVFWSLAIEFQFYLSIALCYPVFANPRVIVRAAGLALVAIGTVAGHSPVLIFHYLGLFGCGLACFQFKTRRLGRWAFVATTAVMAAAAWSGGDPWGPAVAFTTALAIAWGRGGSALGTWLGSISYSLYLLHAPVGGRVINAGARFADTLALQLLVLTAGLAASLAAAIALNRLVEQPAQRWSNAIRYTSRAVDRLVHPARGPIVPDTPTS